MTIPPELLQKWRIECGLTPNEMAEFLYVENKVYKKWENGDEIPNKLWTDKILEVYGLNRNACGSWRSRQAQTY